MPIFNFNPVKSKKTNRIKKIIDSEIVEKHVEGVVCIKLDGSFYVLVDKAYVYKIYIDNYSCKNKEQVFSLQLDSKTKTRICYLRIENRQALSNKCYLPFAPGCCVKGNIIKKGCNIYFDIKKVFINNEFDYAKEAFNFFKNNYEEIMNNRMKETFKDG